MARRVPEGEFGDGDEGGVRTTRRELLVRGAGLAVGAAVVAGGPAAAVAAAAARPAAAVSRGGTLSVAVVGGGQAETLNPLADVYDPASTLRGYQLFDWLVYAGPNLETQLQLAESIEPNASGTEWTIRLRSGVEFHDGKSLTADDLIYTLRYIANPKTASANASVGQLMSTKAIKKLDALTIRVPMVRPIGDLIGLMTINGFAVIQDGTTSFTHPIGTGPFKFVSWVPGQHSVFARNPNYWVHGEPYVDQLNVLSIADDTARLNALIGGEVDAISPIDAAEAKAYLAQGSSSPVQILVGNGPNSTTFTMGTAHAPFNDVRVRQAIRLIVDRPQMIADAQLGFGELSNDLFGQGYQYYDNDLPQRKQDIEQAKSLLKQAGHEKLTLTLSSSDGVYLPGQLAAATLLAQQAIAAGVTIKVLNLPAATYLSTVFPNYAFAQVQWQGAAVPYQYLQEWLPGAPYNACQWKDPTTTSLIDEALSTVDVAQATERWHAVQKIMWETGAEIFWGTCPSVDAVSTKIGGATASKASSLNNWNFNRWYIKS